MPSINTNVAAIKARSNLDKVQRDMNVSIARLSSGKRITRAHDDAAGNAIAGRMESQIRGLAQQVRSAKDGQSLVDTQEGSMQEINSILQRMRELAVQASSGAMTSTDKDYLNLEMKQLVAEIDAISENTKFNDVAVLTGAGFSFYTDIDVAGTAITTTTAASGSNTLLISVTSIDISSATSNTSTTGVAAVITRIDSALAKVDSRRAALGAVSNRFDHIIDNLQNVIMNTFQSKLN